MLAGAGAFVVTLALQLSVWPTFECQRYMIRSEMKARMLLSVPQEELTVYRFTQAEFGDLDFEDGGHEVRLNGAMHDIVRIARDIDGTMLVQVVRDAAETALLADLDRRVRGLQEADTRGQEQRRLLTSMWPGFHEPLSTTTFDLPAMFRHFPEEQQGYHHTADTADPGPPRLA